MSISEKLTQIAENEQKVYDAGMAKGIEQGKKAEYDAFWDAYQDYGNRTDYMTAFSGYGWTEETFKPKYDIIPTNAYMIARAFLLRIDLVDYLERLGVKMDLSKAINTQYLFNGSAFTRIGVVDVSSSTNTIPLDTTFAGCVSLVTIDKIRPKAGTMGEMNNAFNNCRALENVTFEGEITANGLNLQWSTNLSHDSLVSIINCLQDKSADTSGTVWKVIVGSTNYAKLTDEDLINIAEKGWVFE